MAENCGCSGSCKAAAVTAWVSICDKRKKNEKKSKILKNAEIYSISLEHNIKRYLAVSQTHIVPLSLFIRNC